MKVTVAQVIEAIDEYGFITQSARALGISRRHLHRLINKHPTIKEAVEDAKERMKDLAESKLKQGIEEGNPTLIIFYLKTQAKDRGYIERQEFEHSGDFRIEVNYGDRNGQSKAASPQTD
jgi:DNA invertase Pin-like site-specific DNA recombinase